MLLYDVCCISSTNILSHVVVIISYVCIANIDKPYIKKIVSNSFVMK